MLQTGVGLVLRHMRNGAELEPIMVDNAYDFNYQDSRKYLPPRTVLKAGTCQK